jgi:hypothetical protein
MRLETRGRGHDRPTRVERHPSPGTSSRSSSCMSTMPPAATELRLLHRQLRSGPTAFSSRAGFTGVLSIGSAAAPGDRQWRRSRPRPP